MLWLRALRALFRLRPRALFAAGACAAMLLAWAVGGRSGRQEDSQELTEGRLELTEGRPESAEGRLDVAPRQLLNRLWMTALPERPRQVAHFAIFLAGGIGILVERAGVPVVVSRHRSRAYRLRSGRGQ